MVTRTKDWRRWCGPRSELVRATELAADVLRTRFGFAAAIEVRTEDRHGASETNSGLESIASLHPSELTHLDSVVVKVKYDSDAWKARFDEQWERDQTNLPIPESEVRIRVTSYGTTLTVESEDRTAAEGLFHRLVDLLGRAATDSPGFDRAWFLIPTGGLAALGLILGALLSRPLGLASNDKRIEAWEVIGAAVGLILPFAVAVPLWWCFPPLEMFDEGGAGRFRRFRVWIFGVVGTLALGVIASAVYAAIA